ncbi:hypothetical protein IHV25_06265 [Phaeovibrio sulfidiphilus]|uniref:DUF3426 domain-containing protein n=1 Tax=Phaeovibrio sulfidiphilus TaxID=1220600 RepID=A0A8J7CCG2_9PROT|nr:hypothetical protein [Phaeovibrio sulfidiphilus]MBE1237248.1 hypothetical protein [Phaeovibrio sulfidiphilus]
MTGAASRPEYGTGESSPDSAPWQAPDRAAPDPAASHEAPPPPAPPSPSPSPSLPGSTVSEGESRPGARASTLSAPFDGGRVPANGTSVSGPDDILSFTRPDAERAPFPSVPEDLPPPPAGPAVDGFAEFDTLQTPEDLLAPSDAGEDETYDPFGNDPLLSSSPEPEPEVPAPRPLAGSEEGADSFFSFSDAPEADGPVPAPPVFEGGPWDEDAGFSQQGGDERRPFFGPVDGDPEPEPEPEPEVQMPATPLDRALSRLEQALDQAEGASGPLRTDLRPRAGARPDAAPAPDAPATGDAARERGASGPAADGRLPKISSGPVPSRSVRGRRVLEVLAAILIVVNVACISFLLLRDPIARLIPETARVYALLGVPLSAVDDRLIFQNTVEENSPPGVQPRSLTVRGYLHNPSETTPLPVDGILLQVFGADDTMLQWVRGEVSRKVLQPGESVEFEITMLNLSELAYSYRLSLAQGR